ncbi:hypothetical protein E4U55_007913 [Claviceps digitariae]|nr:hypothetical protein E4U55_007913 [Claviceps digitariae]
MAQTHSQNTAHPLYVAGNHHHHNTNNHNLSWGDDAHRRWLTTLGPFPTGGQSPWQNPRPHQRLPHQHQHGAPGGQPAGSVPTGHDGGQDASEAVMQGGGLSATNKDAHEAWASTYQKIWAGNARHPGASHFHVPSRQGPSWHGFAHWQAAAAPWSAAGLSIGGPQWMRPAHGDDDAHKTFVPDVDVLETPERVAVHASLPGAKKEDIKVSWDPNTCELSIEGVISRPGGDNEGRLPEQTTLTVGERQIGSFRRSVYLGSHVDAEKIDAGGLTAVMEDGVLIIDVPSREHNEKEVTHITIT